MIIDIANILKEVGASESFEGEITLEDIDFREETLRFSEPLHVVGSITNLDEFLILKAGVSGEVTLNCGFCAEDYQHKMNFSFEAKLQKTPNEEDPDVFQYQGEKIDPKDIVMEYLLLELPIARRCKEDCKGLCTYCGTNLNKAECQCEGEEEQEADDQEDLDQRLAALKDFFSTRGKEV